MRDPNTPRNSTDTVPNRARFPDDPVLNTSDDDVLPPVRTFSAAKTPINSATSNYSRDDVSADADLREVPWVLLHPRDAREYLTKDMPLKTHPIWKSLLSWNKDHVHLLTNSRCDFCLVDDLSGAGC